MAEGCQSEPMSMNGREASDSVFPENEKAMDTGTTWHGKAQMRSEMR